MEQITGAGASNGEKKMRSVFDRLAKENKERIDALSGVIEVAKSEIADMLRELDALKKEAAQEQWEPEGGRFWIDYESGVAESRSATTARLAGVERKSREIAERDAAQLRKIQRFMAWRAEDSDETGAWMPMRHDGQIYGTVLSVASWQMGIALTEGACDRLCAALNSGEVVL